MNEIPVRLRKSQIARREVIIEAALGLLRDRPNENIQMRDVAEAADVALGTLYRYFPSKEELFAHVYERWCEEYWATLKSESSGTSNAARLTKVALRSVKVFEQEPQFLTLSSMLSTSSETEVVLSLERVRRGARSFFLQSIEGVPDEDANDIVDIMLAVLFNKLSAWVTGRAAITDVYRAVERCIELLFEFSDDQAGAPA